MSNLSHEDFKKYNISLQLPKLDKPIAMMLIGVPGAGKSTFVNSFFNSPESEKFIPGCGLISTDYFIENWAHDLNATYNDIFKDSIKLAEKFMYKTLEMAISMKRGFIWDQTNISKKVRKNKLDKIPDSYYKIAIYFETPTDLYDRLSGRVGKQIPEDVMSNMIKNIELPSSDEGFNSIIIIKANNESIH